MPTWRLFPVAKPEDPRWLDHPIWQEVVVEASSAAEARVVAGNLLREREDTGPGNESPADRTGFEDEKLYWVQEAADAPAGRGPLVRAVRLMG